MALEDRDDLRQFLMDFEHLMLELTDAGAHPDLLSPERRSELGRAVAGLAEVFNRAREQVSNPVIETSPPLPGRLSLADADLMGASRERKVSGFRRALQRFRARSSRRTLGRVFRWANMILGSRATVIPPAEALKELKEYAENLVANEEEDAASV
jgi:hypothetical protein